MRWVSSILLIVGMASPALAADYDIPILRGSQPPAPVVTVLPATFTRWSGFYVGGDFSFNNSSAEFSSATQPLFADSFRDLTLEEQAHPSQIQVLGKGTSNAFGGGGFVGYNTQGRICGAAVYPLLLLANFGPTVEAVYALCVRQPARKTDERAGDALDTLHSDNLRFGFACPCRRL